MKISRVRRSSHYQVLFCVVWRDLVFHTNWPSLGVTITTHAVNCGSGAQKLWVWNRGLLGNINPTKVVLFLARLRVSKGNGRDKLVLPQSACPPVVETISSRKPHTSPRRVSTRLHNRWTLLHMWDVGSLRCEVEPAIHSRDDAQPGF
jgi:hypothetical protein